MAHWLRLCASSRGLIPSQGTRGLPWWFSCKESTCNAGTTEDIGSIPGSGRCPGAGNGNLLQCSCLENPMDRRAWRATVHGAAKSRTGLSDWHLDPTWQKHGQLPRQRPLGQGLVRGGQSRVTHTEGFPGSPVARTQHFHCWGPRFSPWLGTTILQAQQKEKNIYIYIYVYLFIVNYFTRIKESWKKKKRKGSV